MSPNRRRRAKRSKVKQHALDRLRERCRVHLSAAEVWQLVAATSEAFRSPNGTIKIARLRGVLVAFVVKDRVVETVLNLEHAFANCPKGTFFALVTMGELVAALNMRAFYIKEVLPEAHGTDDGNYKYPKQRASAVWDAFKWSDAYQ